MSYAEATVAWAENQTCCWSCGRKGSWPVSLQIHHFVRGCNRHANEMATLGAACEKCHREEHNGHSLGLLRWMALKVLYDAEYADRVKVNTLRGRAPDAISEAELAVEVSSIFRIVANERHGHAEARA